MFWYSIVSLYCMCSCSPMMEVQSGNVRNCSVPPSTQSTAAYQAAPHTTQAPSVEEVKPKTSCCSVKYRVRWVSSKGALLVLLWNVMLNFSAASISTSYEVFISNQSNIKSNYELAVLLPYAVWGVIAPVAGLLADSFFGTYRVTKIGILLLFLSTVVNCVILQVADHLVEFDSPLLVTVFVVNNAIGLTGQTVVLVSLMTLGLQQMPDASTPNITSFIAWFVCSFEAGYWICYSTSYTLTLYTEKTADYIRIWSLFPVLSVCVVLISDFFFSSKWLIIEPKAPQSLKIIFQVFKFAAKHKAPLNRSALTYWEEDIPSRIDLGKSKYGGPFSIEEVEDVKVVLRLSVTALPVMLVILSFNLIVVLPSNSTFFGSPDYTVIFYVVDSINAVVVLGTVVYEFFIFPLISHLLPTIFKRIGLAAVCLMLVSAAYLSLCIAHTVNPHLTWPWLDYPHFVIVGLLKLLWMTSTLELIVAQSPYRMRGLSIGLFWFVVLFTMFISYAYSCQSELCTVLYGGISTAFSVVGFVLFCFLARWYKRRVREDTTTPYQWADEAYDRYLQANLAARQRR